MARRSAFNRRPGPSGQRMTATPSPLPTPASARSRVDRPSLRRGAVFKQVAPNAWPCVRRDRNLVMQNSNVLQSQHASRTVRVVEPCPPFARDRQVADSYRNSPGITSPSRGRSSGTRSAALTCSSGKHRAVAIDTSVTIAIRCVLVPSPHGSPRPKPETAATILPAAARQCLRSERSVAGSGQPAHRRAFVWHRREVCPFPKPTRRSGSKWSSGPRHRAAASKRRTSTARWRPNCGWNQW